MKRIMLLLGLVVYITACSSGGDSSNGGNTGPVFSGPDQNGIITFETITPSSYGELLDAGSGLARDSITGVLYLPSGTATVPAMVIGHGSSGTGSKQIAWANYLNGRGVAAFIVDSYTARGVTNGQSVSSAAETADALFALAVLNDLSRIDSSRIGIMDFGSGPGINTSFSEIKATVNTYGADFVAHVVLYANCNIRLMSANISSAPMLMLHGEDDDWNSSSSCADYASDLNNTQGSVTITTYPDAHHGFDGTGSVSARPTTKSNINCSGEFRIDTRVLRRFDTGQVFADGNAYRSYLDSCRTLGTTSGGNATARVQAFTDVDGFLTTIFGL